MAPEIKRKVTRFVSLIDQTDSSYPPKTVSEVNNLVPRVNRLVSRLRDALTPFEDTFFAKMIAFQEGRVIPTGNDLLTAAHDVSVHMAQECDRYEYWSSAWEKASDVIAE